MEFNLGPSDLFCAVSFIFSVFLFVFSEVNHKFTFTVFDKHVVSGKRKNMQFHG